MLGHDLPKSSNSMYRTFHTIRDSDFFRPKVLVDSTTGENEPIEQINALYMKGSSLCPIVIYLFLQSF